MIVNAGKTKTKTKKISTHRYPLLTGLALSALPFEPSRSTLCRDISWSVNGLRRCRFLAASNVIGRYIGGRYGEKPPRDELLGCIIESHSCFKLVCGVCTGVDGVEPPDKLFRCCRRFNDVSNWVSWDWDWAAARRPCSVDKPLTCRFSAAFRKLFKASCDTCTSPLYMNSNKADIFSADVASNITTHEPLVGAVSNNSAKFFEQAANINLCALKTVPVRERERKHEINYYLETV